MRTNGWQTDGCRTDGRRTNGSLGEAPASDGRYDSQDCDDGRGRTDEGTDRASTAERRPVSERGDADHKPSPHIPTDDVKGFRPRGRTQDKCQTKDATA